VTGHSQVITGLTCATLYHYKVTSGDVGGGNSASSPDATFTTSACSPPVITAVTATPTASGATVTWTTDRATTSQVAYGLTASYGSSTTLDNTLVTSHSQAITGLTCATLYHYKVTSADVGGGNSASSPDATFTTNACTPGAPVSDDFHGALKSNLWTFVNPVGDGTLQMTGTHAILSVPANTAHDVWTTGNMSARLMQTIANVDFQVLAKFDSTFSAAFQTNGLIAEQDSSNYLRFDVYFDGSSTHIFSATFVGGAASVKTDTIVAAGTPLWLQLTRAGNAWTGRYSTDGTNFTTAVTHTQAYTIARIGPFAGNSGSTPPAFSAPVDYFFNTASPISPQDGGAPGILSLSVNPASTTAAVIWTTNRAATGQVNYGLTSSYVSSTPLNSTLLASHAFSLSGLTCGTVYHYSVTATDAGGANPVSSPDATFSTAACPTGGPVSDNFDSGTLGSLWTIVNPLSDGGSATVNGTSLLLAVPAGNTHDVWTGANNSVRVMQNISNVDFDIEVKFRSMVNSQYQMQGLIVEQDANNYLRFDVFQADCQSAAFSASFAGGTPTVQLNTRIANGANYYVRLKRTGNLWSYSYSYDRQHWTSAIKYTYSLNVTRIGAFAGNSGPNGGPAPAFTAIVDYFANRAAPPATDGGQPFGYTSAPPVVTFWNGTSQTFGQNGQPQQWVNILGNVADPDGMASLTYSLNGGAEQTLWMGENAFRLVGPGDFNAEIDYASLSPGSNTVRITATDLIGNQSVQTVTVNYVSGVSWPKTYTANWSAAGGNIQNAAQITDGRWTIEAAGTVRTLQTGYDRLITLGDTNTWSDYEVLTQMTIHSLNCHDFGVGVVTGWHGHTTLQYGVPLPDQPRTGHPFPGLGWYSMENAPNSRRDIYCNTNARPETVLIQDTSGRQLQLETAYWLKFRTQHNSIGGSHYSLKVWAVGTTEPVAWDLEVDGELNSGSIVLGAHRVDVSFGNVTVTGL
jgi:regulation of enolase protein 1 (concanavalin A-like superfamily)